MTVVAAMLLMAVGDRLRAAWRSMQAAHVGHLRTFATGRYRAVWGRNAQQP